MANEIYKIIDKLRQFFGDSFEEEEEDYEPGQLIDEDSSIVINRIAANTSEYMNSYLDGRLYQERLELEGEKLLHTYNSNAIYRSTNDEITRKVNGFMKRTNAYYLIKRLHKRNLKCVQKHLDNIVEQVTSILDVLLILRAINESQFRQMNVKRSRVRMDYLFFLPDVRQENVPFQPMMICSLGPTIDMARYISRILQPIYDQAALTTTFFKESDAVYAMEMYKNRNLLLPTTWLVNLHMNDLCTIISHEEIIQGLERFLIEFYTPDQYIQGINMDTIIELVQFILENQFFVFKNKIYQQIKGGTPQSPLTILLMNIYMFYWQEDLVKILIDKNEIFGRCFDEIFLTWNGSQDEFHSLLQVTLNKRPSLQITTSIGKKINYMDAQICHVNGKLQTKINHDNDTEPRTLPYVYGHPHDMYSTLIRAALIRAVLCCSNMKKFYYERRDIEKTFHSHGYSWNYINRHVKQFFQEFNVLQLLRSRYNQFNYDKLRRSMFKYDQEQRNIKMEQRKAEQNKLKWYIPTTLEGEALTYLQEQFEPIWKNSLKNNPESSNVAIEIINHLKYPSNTK